MDIFLPILEEFLTFLLAERGLAPLTAAAYRSDLLALFASLQERGILAWEEVKEEHIVHHLHELKERGMASSSMARAQAAFRVFFRFLQKEEWVERSCMELLVMPKLWKRLPAVLSESEIERLLAIPSRDQWEGARDAAILEVLYGSGLRVSELCTLGLHSVDERGVRVKGKGGKERIVPLGKKALQAIDHYLALCPHQSERATLFVTKEGEGMTRFEVWRMVKRVGREAGIEKPLSPHSFRHAFATHLLNRDANLRIIQEMLGHASITTTDRYTQVSSTRLKKEFFRCHPRP